MRTDVLPALLGGSYSLKAVVQYRRVQSARLEPFRRQEVVLT